MKTALHRPTEQVALGPLGDALTGWTTRNGPMYSRLADALADAIAQGHLGLGSRLPSERALAQHLRVARGTVVAAYDSLRARGIVTTRRGSGTVVEIRAAKARAHRAPLLSRLVNGHEVAIDLSIAAPLLDASQAPEVSVSLTHAARLAPAHGYAPLGLPALRAALAERFSARGIPTETDQILITQGGQGAISLIAAALLNVNGRVMTEAPTYPAAIEAFVRAGARVEGVERDHAGVVIASLEEVIATGSARILYLIPTCHNPTGGVMSEGRRLATLRTARERGVRVIEDAVLEDLTFDGRKPSSLAALDPEQVITVGSLSKVIYGGLRVGWIRASSETILRLGRLRASYDLGSPVLEQAAALTLLDRYEELAAARRELLEARVSVLVEELRGRLPEWRFQEPRGGLCIWAALPGVGADFFAQCALREGVAVSPGRSAAPGEEFLSHIRLCASLAPDQLREGVRRLAVAWERAQLVSTLRESEGVFV